MKNKFTYLILTVIGIFCFSCNHQSGTTDNSGVDKETPAVTEEVVSQQLEIPEDTISDEALMNESTLTKAIILSVGEELIMPSDYLTTAMTVKTVTNDTLVFLDMFGFEELVNQEITIQYKLTPGTKLLVCFDCTSYSEKIQLHDITSFLSDVVFENLKLKEYVPDPYIVPAATFSMIKNDGTVEEFYSNDSDLISDSLRMKAEFYSYGIVTKLYPELENREELEQLVK
ncbi:hypothetical protein [Ekhidna sp.]